MYPSLNSPQGTVEMPRTLSDKLRDQKVMLEAQLKDVNAALQAIEKNPEILTAFNAISKVRGIGY